MQLQIIPAQISLFLFDNENSPTPICIELKKVRSDTDRLQHDWIVKKFMANVSHIRALKSLYYELTTRIAFVLFAPMLMLRPDWELELFVTNYRVFHAISIDTMLVDFICKFPVSKLKKYT